MRKFNCLRDESMGRSLARRLLDPRIDLSSLRRVERGRLRCALRWRLRWPDHEGGVHGYAATREAAMAAFVKSWRGVRHF